MHGLDITFWYKNGCIETSFIPHEHHAGYHRLTHGGLLATLLDECMGWSGILSRPILCKSVELTIRYKRSAWIGEPYIIQGNLQADKKRLLLTQGTIENGEGTLICTAEGKYIPMSEEEIAAFQHQAGWGNTLQTIYNQIHA